MYVNYHLSHVVRKINKCFSRYHQAIEILMRINATAEQIEKVYGICQKRGGCWRELWTSL